MNSVCFKILNLFYFKYCPYKYVFFYYDDRLREYELMF